MKHSTEHGYLNRHISDTLETVYDGWDANDYVGTRRHADTPGTDGCEQ
ncbi:hypothetical protein RND64_08860 [Gordonia sp. w5E2]|nr:MULTISPECIES: hypothetical protein [Gordonia]